ncbi:MAG TPA: hypothetical protein VFB66_19825 [Tepidisphaeraceae bacterium]|nr:hypothetical protein [Tepidisphaeraceae bacterium]
MTRIRRAGRAVAVFAAALCVAAAARAQEVLDQVPPDALVVVKFNNLGTANQKAGKWAEAMGMAQVSPESKDPLGSLEAKMGLKGIDRSGDAAFVFVDPKLVGGKQDKAFLILVPTKDYKSFAASLPGAKTAGNVTTFRAEDSNQDGYAMQWGNFAALAGTKELLAKKGTGLKVTGLAAKELAEKDVVFYANVPSMRQRLLPELKKQRQELRQQVEKAKAKSGRAEPAGERTAPAERATPPAGNRGATGATPRRGTPAPTPAPKETEEKDDSATDNDTGAVNGFGFPASVQERPRRQPAQPPARQQPARRPAPPKPVEEEPEAENEKESEGADGDSNMDELPDALAEYGPALGAVADQWFAVAERFLTDANAATFSLNLTDEGINGAMTAEFSPGSYMGKIAQGLKNGEGNFMAGLPDRKYFAYGGVQISPDVMGQLITDWTQPVLKELAGTSGGGQDTTAIVNALKQIVGNAKTASFGYTVPTGALGADSVIQQVTVVNGNAKQVAAASRTLVKTMGNQLEAKAKEAMAEAGEEGGQPPATVDFEFKEGGKTAGGLKLDVARLNVDMDAENNPQAAQAQQGVALIFGPNGMSMTMGAVNDQSFLFVQGGTDKLVADAIASAQKPQDRLGALAQVKQVSGQLPKNKVAVFYVALDQIVTSAAGYAQGMGMPVKVQLPKNLPPIGASVSSEGTALRADWHVPTQLVQSLVAAGMQQYMEMQGGPAAEPADGL